MAKKKPAARPAPRSTAARTGKSAKPAKAAAKPAGRAASKKASTKPAKSVAKRSKGGTGQTHMTIAVAKSAGALPMFVVDAFTARPFHGNPAAVVVVADAPPSDEVMQAISAENNLSETAFVIMGKTGPRIRWFTPTTEVDLCGHATLAAAHVLWQHFDIDTDDLTFASRSGKLDVSRLDIDLYELDFPARPGTAVPITKEMSAAIGRMPAAAYIADDLMLVLDNRRDVYDLHMDHTALAKLPGRGVIVTAPGSGHDFVSRCFYPRLGIAEDPVTGSAHCTLVPYWSSVLGKARLRAHQVSKRGGELWCTFEGKRVRIAGHAVTYSAGMIVAG